MNFLRLVSIHTVVSILVLLGFGVSARSQPASIPGATSTAQGQMSVTITVTSSVGIIIAPDGEPTLILANAADPKDGVATAYMHAMVPWRNGNRETAPEPDVDLLSRMWPRKTPLGK